MLSKSLLLTLLLSFFSPVNTYAASHFYEQHPYSLALSYTKVQKEILNHILRFKYGEKGYGDIFSIDGSMLLAKDNPVRRFFSPLVSTTSIGLNLSKQNDVGRQIYEFNPYIIWRWTNFPWDQYISTSLALAEGISYASAVPYQELIDSNQAGNTRHVLNYLLFEATIARPAYKNIQLLYRVHHRSGAFGLYTPGLTGSTSVGGGIRAYF